MYILEHTSSLYIGPIMRYILTVLIIKLMIYTNDNCPTILILGEW